MARYICTRVYASSNCINIVTANHIRCMPLNVPAVCCVDLSFHLPVPALYTATVKVGTR
jgi:hypothetical protein